MTKQTEIGQGGEGHRLRRKKGERRTVACASRSGQTKAECREELFWCLSDGRAECRLSSLLEEQESEKKIERKRELLSLSPSL